jgi:hypothetical protein
VSIVATSATGTSAPLTASFRNLGQSRITTFPTPFDECLTTSVQSDSNVRVISMTNRSHYAVTVTPPGTPPNVPQPPLPLGGGVTGSFGTAPFLGGTWDVEPTLTTCSPPPDVVATLACP